MTDNSIPDMPISELAAVARSAATASANLLRAGFGQAELVSQDGRDIKLGEDRRSQDIIVDTIRSQSALPILTEESGWIGEQAVGSQLYWVVDPLDGSFNYHIGAPLCCTSVALCSGKMPIIGCVNDFMRRELFWGGSEIGLYRNDKRLEGVIESRGVFATGFPVGGDHSEESFAHMIGKCDEWKKIRMIGSAALSLAWVAYGPFDAYAEKGIRWWDVAAGLALVQAVGGVIEVDDNEKGRDFLLDVSAKRDGRGSSSSLLQ